MNGNEVLSYVVLNKYSYVIVSISSSPQEGIYGNEYNEYTFYAC